MKHATYIDFDSEALLHNFTVTKQLSSTAKIMGMIKSNAYGHGLLRVARTLAKTNIDYFGVACITEAIKLRQAKIHQPIVIMHGFYNSRELIKASNLSLQITIHEYWQVQMLEQIKLTKTISIWIRIDIDNNFLGFSIEEFDNIYKRLKNCRNVKIIGIMAHIMQSKYSDITKLSEQVTLFKNVTKTVDVPKSIASSGTILSSPDFRLDCIRPGTMLYGISPLYGYTGAKLGLKQVMTLKSKLHSIKLYKQGNTIGYGNEHKCSSDMLIGTIPMGYGDGYPLNVNSTPVLVNGHLCQIIGAVSMDLLAIDLSNYPKAKLGDLVILWGKELPIEQVAVSMKTIPPELTCRLTKRVSGMQ